MTKIIPIGASLSVISKSQVRYLGTLKHFDAENSTLTLENVRAFGTEGRRAAAGGGIEIPPSNDVFPSVLFRGSDVSDIKILYSAPNPPAPVAPVANDPAHSPSTTTTASAPPSQPQQSQQKQQQKPPEESGNAREKPVAVRSVFDNSLPSARGGGGNPARSLRDEKGGEDSRGSLSVISLSKVPARMSSHDISGLFGSYRDRIATIRLGVGGRADLADVVFKSPRDAREVADGLANSQQDMQGIELRVVDMEEEEEGGKNGGRRFHDSRGGEQRNRTSRPPQRFVSRDLRESEPLSQSSQQQQQRPPRKWEAGASSSSSATSATRAVSARSMKEDFDFAASNAKFEEEHKREIAGGGEEGEESHKQKSFFDRPEMTSDAGPSAGDVSRRTSDRAQNIETFGEDFVAANLINRRGGGGRGGGGRGGGNNYHRRNNYNNGNYNNNSRETRGGRGGGGARGATTSSRGGRERLPEWA